MTDTQNKKELYKGYIKEGLENMRAADLLKVRMKEIKDAVKESDFDVKEFTQDVKTAHDKDKTEKQLEALQISIESVTELGL